MSLTWKTIWFVVLLGLLSTALLACATPRQAPCTFDDWLVRSDCQ